MIVAVAIQELWSCAGVWAVEAADSLEACRV